MYVFPVLVVHSLNKKNVGRTQRDLFKKEKSGVIYVCVCVYVCVPIVRRCSVSCIVSVGSSSMLRGSSAER